MDSPSNVLVALAVLGAAGAAMLAWRFRRHAGGRKIRVVGVGGAGSNAIEAMIRARLRGVDYVVVNTDARALRASSAGTKIAIGRPITNGLGAGGDVMAGEVAARDATDQIGRALAGSDFVIIATGLGGGTGSGATPVIADIARQQGTLTMAVVTLPFGFEGARRRQLAQESVAALAAKVDAVAAVPNDRVREMMPADVTVDDAFRAIDETLCSSVSEIIDLVSAPGRMNLDLADVRSVLQGGGAAAVGIGRAAGENRAGDAARRAMAGALPGALKVGRAPILVNVAGSSKLRLAELDAAAEAVLAAAGRDADLVFGLSVRPRLRDEVQVTVIATGLDRAAATEAPASEEATAVWRPVWLRRATEERSTARAAPSPRSGRKTAQVPEADTSAAAGPSVEGS